MRNRNFIVILTVLAIIAAPVTTVFPASVALAAPAAATTNTILLNVVSAGNAGGHSLGEVIPQYKYIINEDVTGNPNDSEANCRPATNPSLAGCEWPSIHKMQGDAPIVTQGDQNDFNGVLHSGFDLPNGKYLISVVADGYKIGGQHFSVPLDAANNTIKVELEPNPLPTTTYRAMVFNDNASPNGAMDVPGEVGLNGFEGVINDVLGQISVDWFGNPLCTEYERDGSGNIIFDGDGAPIPIDGTGGICLSGDTNHDGKVNPPTIQVDGTGTAVPNPDYNPAYPDDNPADQGMIVIPNLGPNRVAALAIPPDNTDWVQTTTLEGWHDYDTWMMAGGTGYDTEFLYQNELFPWTVFGFVKPAFAKVNSTTTAITPTVPSYSGEIKGTAWSAKIYVPSQGGLGINSLGIMGAKTDYRVNRPWIALSDLNNGDQMIYAGRGNPDGSFDIKNVPPSDYLVTVWDDPQNLIMDGLQLQVSVSNGVVYVGDEWTINGETTQGNVGLAGWWARFNGYVFIDTGKAADGTLLPEGTAGNGKRDCYGPDRGLDPNSGLALGSDPKTCEAGLPQQNVGFKMRGNSVMQHGTTGITTDDNGYYEGKQVYPITSWIVEEVYNDRYKTTGITYQADNEPLDTDPITPAHPKHLPIEHTLLGQGVDVNILPIIGLTGRIDWGVVPYDRTENGGIVGTVTYDVTRNELDPRFAATEDWQPGIPGLRVDLFAPIKCGTTSAPCDEEGKYELAPDGSYAKGPLLNQYVTERWDRPTGCTARDVNGQPVVQQALPTDPNGDCVEAPMDGIQFGPNSDGTNFGATVDGNYGFGDGCFGDGNYFVPDAYDPNDPTTVGAPGSNPGHCYSGEPSALTPGNYLVQVEVPNDPIFHRPLYKVTREEDINVFTGDTYVPQVPPPACAGTLHTVDVAGIAPDGPNAVDNPTLVEQGGSPWEGKQTPLCDMKLIPVQNGKSIAPNFNFFTDVPLPAHYMGLTVDNLNLSTDSKSTAFGEVAGIPHNPYGVYNFAGRLVYTGESDVNGIWEVLMPSSLDINCPTPSGVCPDMYRFVGNDPGQPYHRNANWNPQYQTISAPFEAWPGVINPADLAPMPVATTIELQGTRANALAVCTLPSATPKLFAVNQPYVNAGGTLIIAGDAFGDTQGAGSVTMDGTPLSVGSIANWTNGVITATVPAAFAAGPHQLMVTANGGASVTNGLTVHVIDSIPLPMNTSVISATFDSQNNGALGNNWAPNSGNNISQNDFRVDAHMMQIRASNSTVYWNAGSVPVSSQYAFFKFTDLTTSATEIGLVLKRTSASNLIRVFYNPTTSSVTVQTLDSAQGAVDQATFTGVTFNPGDIIAAAATADGLVYVFQNGVQIGNANLTTGTAPWPMNLVTGGGRIGVTAVGAGSNASNDAHIDNFGGGNLAAASYYSPIVLEVGPGRTYNPTVTTIDPITGLPYEHALQNALDAAANSGAALVAVYPNTPITNTNPAGEYFENIILHSPVKLQGVGPGGIRADGSVVGGAILDGVGYSPDATPSTDWYALLNTLLTPDPNGGDPTALGNPTISDGEVVYVFPTGINQFGSSFKASIDGFAIQGGDQLGFPANINQFGGGQTGTGATATATVQANGQHRITGFQVVDPGSGYTVAPIVTINDATGAGAQAVATIDANGHVASVTLAPGNNGGSNYSANPRVTIAAVPTFQGDVPTQGGGIYVHGYAHYLQVTNNILQSNGGAYAGAIRVGTPSIDNHNDHLRIAYNRVLANGGTNLAGAIGLFRNSDNYEVDHNDLCGNYSSEYGGAISHFGLSPNGKIHDNRIYYNQSVDEAGGIMIAGELANDPTQPYGSTDGAKGAGTVDIYNNLIQSNIAGDDGGGLRFLMAGNFPYNVYNNQIVNNVSAHEGGGVALDDAPNVRFYNNTVMKNLTTDTAATAAFGTPYPAGLSTAGNSTQLQGTLPSGSPQFSNPLLFNNIFWDNRAGSYNAATAVVEGIGMISDTTPIRNWDMGSTDNISLSPTNSILQTTISNTVNSPTNQVGVDPQVVLPYTTTLSVYPWRSPNRPAPAIVSIDQASQLDGNYHLQGSSTAVDKGASSKAVPSYQQAPTTLSAPKFDIDNQSRPAGAACAFDIGADELQTGGTCADLSITKSDGVDTIMAGSTFTYTITVSNGGPSAVSGAPVVDTFPGTLTVNAWSCAPSTGSSCAVSGTGINRTGSVTLPVGGTATFAARVTLSASATGSLTNMATVAAPVGAIDPNPANNSATDTDTIAPPLPTLTLRDNFNRANANTLGGNWSQLVVFGSAALRVNNNQAFANASGSTYWNVPNSGFAAKQGAAFTFANTSLDNSALILKASGTAILGVVPNFIRVRYNAGQVIVETTTNYGGTYTTQGTLDNINSTFANGDTLSVVVDSAGVLNVWKTTGPGTVFVGSVTLPNVALWTTGTGRIGMQLPNGARVDNFSGGTLP
jgi:uncharacterized repeat protein (TIGR01451 family)